jgi:hypothetical protein
MISMAHDSPQIAGGVDTHGLTHHAAVIDSIGRHLADRDFPASVRGYRDLLDWMRSHGARTAVGVEGTGAYRAELAWVLTAAGVAVVDVDRPDPRAPRAPDPPGRRIPAGSPQVPRRLRPPIAWAARPIRRDGSGRP